MKELTLITWVMGWYIIAEVSTYIHALTRKTMGLPPFTKDEMHKHGRVDAVIWIAGVVYIIFN